MPDLLTEVRLDKWVWAARFFKTRSLASQAVDAGHVRLNGQRSKPARSVKVGDTLHIQVVHGLFEVVVQALAEQRGSATLAQSLYQETPESVQAREAAQLQHSLAPRYEAQHEDSGRPSKRDRRQIGKLRGY